MRLHRTAAFRLTAAASAASFLAGGVVMGVLYWRMLAVIDGQIDRALDREAADMTAVYAASGGDALRRTVTDRASSHPDSVRLYLLLTADGARAGNLALWPPDAPAPGKETKDVATPRGGNDDDARARVLAFPDGGRLLVARSLAERRNFKHIAGETLVSAMLANLAAGVAGGIILARYSLRRLGRINKAAQDVLNGDLARRIEAAERGGGDEYDALARNINAMLARIQRLVATVKGVTENIAHDLRTPLNRLRGRLEVTLMAPRSPEDYQAAITRAIVQADAIVSTFNAMLKIARIRAGAASPQRYRVDLREVAEELIDLYQPMAEENGVSITACAVGDLAVMGDGRLIAQAAANLLDNAIKYSPAGGVIELGASREKDAVRLSVADSGPGIPAELHRLALEPFKRLNQSGESQGSGLGLSFVAAVAEWHGAEFQLSDNGPGLRAALVFVDGAAPSTLPTDDRHDTVAP
jgi:signal transduction histidine kinase